MSKKWSSPNEKEVRWGRAQGEKYVKGIGNIVYKSMAVIEIARPKIWWKVKWIEKILERVRKYFHTNKFPMV